MKTTRLITHWNADQLVTVIDMLDELRHALITTYRQEINEYQDQCRVEQKEQVDDPSMFDDEIPF